MPQIYFSSVIGRANGHSNNALSRARNRFLVGAQYFRRRERSTVFRYAERELRKELLV